MKNISKILIVLIMIVIVLISVSSVFAIKLPTDPGYNPDNVTNDAVKTKANTIVATFTFLVQIACVATIIIMGLRYMLTAAEGKADVKKGIVVWCVGAFIVFGATTLMGLVLNVITGEPEDSTSPSIWAESDWNNAISEGIVPSSIIDKPHAQITRGEFAEMVYYLAHAKGKSWASVEGQELSKTDIMDKLYDQNIFVGVSDTVTDFKENELITRQDLASILYRYLGSPDESNCRKTFEAGKGTALYNGISDYAGPAMIYMNDKGIIVGDNINLSPLTNATCEQAVAIVYRAYSK